MKTKSHFPLLLIGILLQFAITVSSEEIPAKQWAEQIVAGSQKLGWFDAIAETVNDRKDLARGLFLELSKQSDTESQEIALKGLAVFGQREDKSSFNKLHKQLMKLKANDPIFQVEAGTLDLFFSARALNDVKAQQEFVAWLNKQNTADGITFAFDLLGNSDARWSADTLVDIVSNRKLSDHHRFASWCLLFNLKDERAIALLSKDDFYKKGAGEFEMTLSKYLYRKFGDDKVANLSDEECIEYLKSNKGIFLKSREKTRIVGDVDWQNLLARSKSR